MEEKAKYFVNSNIHFHPDVPEQVQEFIKRISSDSKQNEKKVENSVPARLPSSGEDFSSADDSDIPGSLSRKPSVQVIVTTEFTPNYLSNADYDKLKEVEDSKCSLHGVLLSWEYLQDTRFTEFEIVQLWQSFKRDFPNGKINKNQLRELMKVIFPRGQVPDLFIENIFRVFDPRYNGAIRFTDLLIAFSMSMKGTGECSAVQCCAAASQLFSSDLNLCHPASLYNTQL